ncbi:DNA polymerase II [Vibrio cholerae]|nr:DNA polymerase II [Vibrio cholerae]
MDSIPGLYDSVLVLDFKSLYPSIARLSSDLWRYGFNVCRTRWAILSARSG